MIVNDAISQRVRGFVEQHISSVETLEALLLVFAQALRYWSAADLAREARSNDWSAEMQLQSLQRAGLLVRTGSLGLYQANPSFSELVAEVEQTFRRSRVAVISLIYSMP